jgi:hypothetical protein
MKIAQEEAKTCLTARFPINYCPTLNTGKPKEKEITLGKICPTILKR